MAKFDVKTEVSTRQRILLAAEPLFAERGYPGVSMRAIAVAAGVHLGQLPYHFGTKEALYREIWEFWIGQVEAGDLLSEIRLEAAASRKDQLRAVVEAFFNGPARMLRTPRGRHFVSIMVREANDPTSGTRGLLEAYLHPNGDRFREELARLFPEMKPSARDIGFEMVIAALRIVIEHPDREQSTHPAEALRQFDLLTRFVVDGWMALAAHSSST